MIILLIIIYTIYIQYIYMHIYIHTYNILIDRSRIVFHGCAIDENPQPKARHAPKLPQALLQLQDLRAQRGLP